MALLHSSMLQGLQIPSLYAYLPVMQKHLLESMLKMETKFSSDKPCTHPNHPVQRQAPEELPLALLLLPGNAEAVEKARAMRREVINQAQVFSVCSKLELVH